MASINIKTKVIGKYTNKRAENMKFTSIFYKASAGYIRGTPQINQQTSGKYEVDFNILQSEYILYAKR